VQTSFYTVRASLTVLIPQSVDPYAERIPIANTTGFMHGGCLRKAFGITYYDPQYLVIQQYARFNCATPSLPPDRTWLRRDSSR